MKFAFVLLFVLAVAVVVTYSEIAQPDEENGIEAKSQSSNLLKSEQTSVKKTSSRKRSHSNVSLGRKNNVKRLGKWKWKRKGTKHLKFHKSRKGRHHSKGSARHKGGKHPKVQKGDNRFKHWKGHKGGKGGNHPKGQKGGKGGRHPKGHKGDKGGYHPKGPKGQKGAHPPKGHKGDKGGNHPKGGKGGKGGKRPKGEKGEKGYNYDKGSQSRKGDHYATKGHRPTPAVSNKHKTTERSPQETLKGGFFGKAGQFFKNRKDAFQSVATFVLQTSVHALIANSTCDEELVKTALNDTVLWKRAEGVEECNCPENDYSEEETPEDTEEPDDENTEGSEESDETNTEHSDGSDEENSNDAE